MHLFIDVAPTKKKKKKKRTPSLSTPLHTKNELIALG